MDTIELEIINWDKHQPNRKDVKHASWFKINNKMIHDPKIFSLTDLQFRLWVYILSLCSLEGSSKILLCVRQASVNNHTRKDRLELSISKFEQLQMVRVVSRNVDGTLDKNRLDKIRLETTFPRNRKKTFGSRGAIIEFTQCNGLLNTVTHEVQKAWLEAYPSAEWVVTEIKRAQVWIASNPQKAPKNFGRFMSGWLNRGFEQYRKGLPTKHLTTSEKNAQVAVEMWKKIDNGEL